MVPTPQQIIYTAQELHKFYRAANKAMFPGGRCGGGAHDHGWASCHKKSYFMYRAVKVLRTLPVGNQQLRDRRPVSKG